MPDDPFIKPPSRILRCDYEDALAVRNRRDYNAQDSDKLDVPKIVINGVDDDNSSDISNDSDNPDKSKIFSKIQKVKFLKTDDELRREGTHLTKEETERCIQELKNIVADFEKCTLEASKIEPIEIKIKEEDNSKKDSESAVLNLDLSGVNSDSDDSDSLVYEYRPLTTSLTDLQKVHDHTSLIRKDSCGHYKSLETIPSSSVKTVKKYKSLDFIPSVKELARTFEKLDISVSKSPKKIWCEHNKLKMVNKHNDAKSIEKIIKRSNDVILKENNSPSRIRIGDGRVAALTKHFSNLGDAGLIKFYDSPNKLKGISDPVINTLIREIYVKADAETQTSVRSAPNLTTAEAEVQTYNEINDLNVPPKIDEKLEKHRNIIKGNSEEKYDYDYSLIYNLGLKKVGFSLDNLLGFPAERLKIQKKRKIGNNKKVEEEKPKKFPKDYIRVRKTRTDNSEFLNARWFSDEVLSPRVRKEAATTYVGGCKTIEKYLHSE